MEKIYVLVSKTSFQENSNIFLKIYIYYTKTQWKSFNFRYYMKKKKTVFVQIFIEISFKRVSYHQEEFYFLPRMKKNRQWYCQVNTYTCTNHIQIQTWIEANDDNLITQIEILWNKMIDWMPQVSKSSKEH